MSQLTGLKGLITETINWPHLTVLAQIIQVVYMNKVLTQVGQNAPALLGTDNSCSF